MANKVAEGAKAGGAEDGGKTMILEFEDEKGLLDAQTRALMQTCSQAAQRAEGVTLPLSVFIRVVDDGVLIPADDLPRIFERFYQVERHRGQNSTGLGLAICKHVIERHGGRIWAESPAEDGSTAIIFTLRRADAPRTPVQE